LSDPDFSPEFDQLLEGSGVTELTVSTNGVKTFTTTNIFSPTSKRAFLAPNPAYFGMGRMAETYNSLRQRPSQIRVFYDLHSALDWLGLKQGDIQWPKLTNPGE
jgi:hypothetical protein